MWCYFYSWKHSSGGFLSFRKNNYVRSVVYVTYFLASYHDCACLRLPHVETVGSYPSLANQSSQLADSAEVVRGRT